MRARIADSLRRAADRLAPPPAPSPPAEQPAPGWTNRFEVRAPSVQNAVDLFSGNWATDLSEALPGVKAGPHRLLTCDARPQWAAQTLGEGGRLDGMSVLELGPLEGAHSVQLERLGAERVVAIEANGGAFLKCLVVKEALGLERVEFQLGDFSAYLRAGPARFDMIFASGVLYHMEDPLELIALMCAASDRCFLWTHYYDADRCQGRTPSQASRGGFEATYHRWDYGAKGADFWGAPTDSASWLARDAILGAFRHFGLTEIVVVQDEPDHPNGPAITFAARRA